MGDSMLSEALTGLCSTTCRKVTIGDRDLTGKSPRAITETGLAHIPGNCHGKT
jgi:ABC-type uncharacterized transport system ATPase subunit